MRLTRPDRELERVHLFWGESGQTGELIERWIEGVGQHLAEIRASARRQAASST